MRPRRWASKDDHDEATQAHPGAGHPQAARSGADLSEGKTIPEAAKALEISEQTFHRWRNQ